METAHRFGRDGHLAGVVNRPDDARAGDLAVVVPNAGFIHHVGPWQLHIDLVQALAAAGITSIRFDLSGLGDSETPQRREAVAARTEADIRDAIDLLQERFGVQRVIMAGLCSGAIDSHRAALVEARVVGAALLDPPAYPDRLYHLIYWAERALNPARILRFLRRKLDESQLPEARGPAQEPYRPISAESFSVQLEEATRRGVEYLFSFSGDGEYKHHGQLFSIVTPGTPRDRVTVYHYPKLDHTPMLSEDRRIIADTLVSWVEERFL